MGDDVAELDSEAIKRANHNVLERKRRLYQKEKLQDLRSCVAIVKPDDKVSTVDVLQKSTEYVHILKNQYNEQNEEIQALQRINQELAQRIQSAHNVNNTSPQPSSSDPVATTNAKLGIITNSFSEPVISADDSANINIIQPQPDVLTLKFDLAKSQQAANTDSETTSRKRSIELSVSSRCRKISKSEIFDEINQD